MRTPAVTRYEMLIAEVRRIHARERVGGHAGSGGAYHACGECFRDWPCDTIRALTASDDPSPCVAGL